MADWSLLQPTPNFGTAALTGYQAGAAIGKQRQLDQAMTGIDLTKPETLLPLLRADPPSGAALIGAAVKLHAEDRAQQAQTVLANAFDPGGGTPAASTSTTTQPALGAPPITASPTPALSLMPTAPATTPGAPATPGTTDADGGITVTAAHPAVGHLAQVQSMPPTLQQSVGRLVRGGVSIDDALKFADMAGKMTKAQSDAVSAQQDAIGSVASAIPKNLSLADRSAWVTAHKDFLLSHNVSEAKIDDFIANPTDENIQAAQTLALGTKDAMTQAREAAALAETQKQHGVENSLSQQRIGLEGQSVGIAGAHLALDRNADARAAKAAAAKTSAGAGGIATPTSASEYSALPSGARYFKNGQIRIKS